MCPRRAAISGSLRTALRSSGCWPRGPSAGRGAEPSSAMRVMASPWSRCRGFNSIMFKDWYVRSALALAAALLLAEPASASTCDERRIAEMSNRAAADGIWAEADAIGFGYVTTVDTLAVERQFVTMVTTLKGAPSRRYALRALREGGYEEAGDGALPRIRARDDEIRFFAMVNTDAGYNPISCRIHYLLAKDRPGMLRLVG